MRPGLSSSRPLGNGRGRFTAHAHPHGLRTTEKDAYTHERLGDMLGLFESMSGWYAQMRRMPTGAFVKFVPAHSAEPSAA